MTARGQQDRPIHRRFRLACAVLACFILMLSGMPRQTASDLWSKAAGYGLNKAAPFKLPPKERECRKRSAPGNPVLASGDDTSDFSAILPGGKACRAILADALARVPAEIVLPGRGLTAHGARAPPAAVT